MNKTILTLVALLACMFTGCNRQPAASRQEKEQNIIGHEAVLTYPTMTATVRYLSDKQLHWSTTDNKGHIQEGTEALSYKRIDKDKFFLNWIERDGTAVSQVLDLGSGKITVYMSYTDKEKGRGGRVADFFEGTVKLK